MRNPTIEDMLLILNDLFTTKIDFVKSTLAFQLFGASLEEKRSLISGICKGLSKKPLSEELKEADLVHDSCARAVHFICLGLEQAAVVSDDTKAFLTKVKETFVPRLPDLLKSYEDEAALAKRRGADLDVMKADLEAFPIGQGMSLYTLVSSHIGAGEKIDALLSTRAETVAEVEASRTKEIFALRSQTVGLFSRFREALVQEIAVNPSLPRDLEPKVFSYFDQLAETRGARFASHKTDTVDAEEPLVQEPVDSAISSAD